MSSIITVTFSPCIDKSTSVARLIPEKKLRCAYPRLEPGGGGINVARAIRKLGGEALALFPAGGYSGKYFIELLQKENVPSLIIETKSETRDSIVVLDEASNQQYRFNMPGNPLSDQEWQKVLRELEAINDASYIVASGSLPPGVPENILAQLAVIAKKKNARFIADTSGEALRYAADEGVYLLKPNLGELGYLIGKEYLEQEEIAAAAKQLVENGKCEVVVVSMGSAGALLVTKTIEKKIVAPSVKIKSTVGAGDSMVAGIVWKLSKGKSLETSAAYGVACGTAATLSPGAGLCKRQDVEMLFKAITNKSELLLT